MYQQNGTTQTDNIKDDELRGLIKSGFENVKLAQNRGGSGYAECMELVSILPPIILEKIFEEGKKAEEDHLKYSKYIKSAIWNKFGKRLSNDSIGFNAEEFIKSIKNPVFEESCHLGNRNREILYLIKMRNFDKPRVMALMNLISKECDKNGMWFRTEQKKQV